MKFDFKGLHLKEFDGRFERICFSPWKRGRPEKSGGYIRTNLLSFSRRFDEDIHYANMDLPLDVKIAALEVSPSVVSLVSYQGDKPFFCGSGIIFDCQSINAGYGGYRSTILTSASLLRSKDGAPALQDNITKIKVQLSDNSLFEGKASFYDWHYNVAAIEIISSSALPICNISLLDDSISIKSTQVNKEKEKVLTLEPSPSQPLLHGDSFHLSPGDSVVAVGEKEKEVTLESSPSSSQPLQHYDSFHLSPGDSVVAVGRHFKDRSLMAAPGIFSIDACMYSKGACNFDCKELMRADCNISKCGVGGPLINMYGQVIGINFHDLFYTPFLPIDIVCKCLKHFEETGEYRHPHHGMTFTNLYAAPLDVWEYVFPHAANGVMVESVVADSTADRAGIADGDIIYECNGKQIWGALHFLGILWDETGKSVELTVLRNNRNVKSKLRMKVGEASQDELNRWPLPDTGFVHIERWRPRVSKATRAESLLPCTTNSLMQLDDKMRVNDDTGDFAMKVDKVEPAFTGSNLRSCRKRSRDAIQDDSVCVNDDTGDFAMKGDEVEPAFAGSSFRSCRKRRRDAMYDELTTPLA